MVFSAHHYQLQQCVWSWPPLLIQLPVMVGHTIMELANFYDNVHGRYSVPWPPVYLKSWPKVYISCYAFCVCSTALVGKPEEVYSCCILLYICWNLHSLADLPVVQPTSVLCMYNTLGFSGGIWLLYLKFLLSHRVRYYFPTPPPVSELCIAHLHMW